MLFPRLNWSDRKVDEIHNSATYYDIPPGKFIVVGEVLAKTQESTKSALSKHVFVMKVDTKTGQEVSVKLIDHQEESVTAAKFGPYDNGYLLLGFADGAFMALDIMQEISIILNLRLFDEPVTSISCEPTGLVFASADQDVVALNLDKKQVNYVYLEDGNRQYFTVAVPKE